MYGGLENYINCKLSNDFKHNIDLPKCTFEINMHIYIHRVAAPPPNSSELLQTPQNSSESCDFWKILLKYSQINFYINSNEKYENIKRLLKTPYMYCCSLPPKGPKTSSKRLSSPRFSLSKESDNRACINTQVFHCRITCC